LFPKLWLVVELLGRNLGLHPQFPAPRFHPQEFDGQ
jgi:hypothetical protein